MRDNLFQLYYHVFQFPIHHHCKFCLFFKFSQIFFFKHQFCLLVFFASTTLDAFKKSKLLVQIQNFIIMFHKLIIKSKLHETVVLALAQFLEVDEDLSKFLDNIFKIWPECLLACLQGTQLPVYGYSARVGCFVSHQTGPLSLEISKITDPSVSKSSFINSTRK